jgi:murein DD-endopeptidase MepM/ murein hydrolase activator NlpD
VNLGDPVVAGQQIMLSGNTGHSSGPHLHLGIRINGVDYCPQPLLTYLYSRRSEMKLVGTGCST